MKEQAASSRRFYLYDPDSNVFEGIGFSLDDDEAVTDIHWTDTPLLPHWKPRCCDEFSGTSMNPRS